MSLTNLARTTSTAPFRRAMNDIFESMERDMLAPWGLASQFPSAGSPFPSLFSSSMNLDFHETDTGFELIADLPGMKEEDITVDVDSESGVLTVSGERKHKREEEKTEDADDGKRKYHFVERSYGKTARSVRLPETADASKATAMYSAGVLTVTFPKKEARPNRRLQIPVVGGDGQGSGDGGGAPVAVRNNAEN